MASSWASVLRFDRIFSISPSQRSDDVHRPGWGEEISAVYTVAYIAQFKSALPARAFVRRTASLTNGGRILSRPFHSCISVGRVKQTGAAGRLRPLGPVPL